MYFLSTWSFDHYSTLLHRLLRIFQIKEGAISNLLGMFRWDDKTVVGYDRISMVDSKFRSVRQAISYKDRFRDQLSIKSSAGWNVRETRRCSCLYINRYQRIYVCTQSRAYIMHLPLCIYLCSIGVYLHLHARSPGVSLPLQGDASETGSFEPCVQFHGNAHTPPSSPIHFPRKNIFGAFFSNFATLRWAIKRHYRFRWISPGVLVFS